MTKAKSNITKSLFPAFEIDKGSAQKNSIIVEAFPQIVNLNKKKK